MIVCVCKRVSESELEAAIADGASTVKALSRKTGCGTQCGRCVSTVREMLSSQETVLPITSSQTFHGTSWTPAINA